jgi:UDP-2,4-diacetamido-2,4,6-trideoxy-beta-L-altropyranose hydrolase
MELPGMVALSLAGETATDDVVHASWLGCSWAEDASQSVAALADNPVDWLIVDHYALDVRWHNQLRSVCQHIMVIDDLVDRPYQCELLVDQTAGRLGAEYLPWVEKTTEILCGSRYAMLRPEFAQVRAASLQRRLGANIKQILITMGGVDQHNVTGRVLLALANIRLPQKSHIVVIMGTQAPWLDQVREQARALEVSVEVKVDVAVADMAILMAESDLAIGAAGATSWERCCLGLPSVMIVLAANQYGVAKALKHAGAAEVIDDPQQIESLLPQLLTDLMTDLQSYRNMSRCAAGVTDGLGVERVVQRLEALT